MRNFKFDIDGHTPFTTVPLTALYDQNRSDIYEFKIIIIITIHTLAELPGVAREIITIEFKKYRFSKKKSIDFISLCAPRVS